VVKVADLMFDMHVSRDSLDMIPYIFRKEGVARVT